MADVVTSYSTTPRKSTAALLDAYRRAALELVQASRLPSQQEEAERLERAAGLAYAELGARVQELEQDRDRLERLARMDSITIGSRTGSPIRKWEKPRLQQGDALRQFLAGLPPVPA